MNTDKNIFRSSKLPNSKKKKKKKCKGNLYKMGSCLKTGQHSIFVIIRKIKKKIIHVCWIPYLLKIL